MTLHLRPVREAIEKAKAQKTQQLRDEVEELRISRLQSQGRIPRHFEQHARFALTAERE